MSSYRTAPLLSLLSAALWLATSPVAMAQSNGNSDRAAIEVIAIEHRAPESIRLLLLDELDARGSIGQIDDKLVIATTAGNLAELKTLIERQDIPPRRVVISADFNHNPALPNPLSRFSEPTLEGQLIEFARYPAASQALTQEPASPEDLSADEEPSVTESDSQQVASVAEPATQPDIALIVSAEVQENIAAVLIEQVDPDGRALRYRMDVTVSEWHVLDPTSGPPLTAIRVDLLP